MKTVPVVSFCVLLASFAVVQAQQTKNGGAARKKSAPVSLTEQWGNLIDAGKILQAKALCTAWVESTSLEKRVEAEKCLANVELSSGSEVAITGNEVGGGSLGTGYTAKAVDAALVHLNAGLKLAPQDISIHEGRLHVLEVSQRYDAMLAALEESISIYKGPGTPDVWLAYSAELGDAGVPTVGLKWSEILDAHYPNNADVIGNLGAFHDMLKQWDLGLPYIRKAVALQPRDPIDNWNLGWSLSHLGQDVEAEVWMRKSLALDDGKNKESLAERKCLLGQFLVKQPAKKVEGCGLVKANCDGDDQTMCVAIPASAGAAPGR